MFNYKELTITYSLKEKTEICNILEDNNIDYKIKTNGNIVRTIGARGIAVDQFGENVNVSCEYKIYVNKTSFSQAQYLIRK